MDLRRLRLHRLDRNTILHAAYRTATWPAFFNAGGRGDARFSPLRVGESTIPTMYAASSQTVALLESAFHEVHELGSRIVSERLRLAPRGLVAITVPASLPLIDLRDEALERLGLGREQLVATSPEHYPCTRQWAGALHARRPGGITPAGVAWHSRIAELAAADSLLLADLLPHSSEVCILFGDRVPTDPAGWRPGDPHFDDLTSGAGRLLAEQIAEQLGAVIVPN